MSEYASKGVAGAALGTGIGGLATTGTIETPLTGSSTFVDYPGNSVYVVKGDYEYMIPAVKEFILSTDMQKNEMQVRIIEGMRSDEN